MRRAAGEHYAMGAVRVSRISGALRNLRSQFERLFGCPHLRATRPIIPIDTSRLPGGGMYVICLGCGKQLAYDCHHMQNAGRSRGSSMTNRVSETRRSGAVDASS